MLLYKILVCNCIYFYSTKKQGVELKGSQLSWREPNLIRVLIWFRRSNSKWTVWQMDFVLFSIKYMSKRINKLSQLSGLFNYLLGNVRHFITILNFCLQGVLRVVPQCKYVTVIYLCITFFSLNYCSQLSPYFIIVLGFIRRLC